jgi:hypothetical protein
LCKRNQIRRIIFGLYRLVVLYESTNDAEEHVLFVFRVEKLVKRESSNKEVVYWFVAWLALYPKDGGNLFLKNVDRHLYYTWSMCVIMEYSKAYSACTDPLLNEICVKWKYFGTENDV